MTKQLVIICLLLNLKSTVYAQPATAPRKIQTPIPTIQQIKPDLKIEIEEVRSVDYDNPSKVMTIKVVIRIMNTSSVVADNVKIAAFVKHLALPSLEHTYFHRFDNQEVIPRLAAGQKLTRLLSFRKIDVPGNPEKIFPFKIKIDPDDEIDEANEENNVSGVRMISYQ